MLAVRIFTGTQGNLGAQDAEQGAKGSGHMHLLRGSLPATSSRVKGQGGFLFPTEHGGVDSILSSQEGTKTSCGTFPVVSLSVAQGIFSIIH